MRMFRKDEGFTLVELMVVVLIIGILVAIAIPVFNAASDSARSRTCMSNQRTIEGAAQQWVAASAGNDIATLAGNVGTIGILVPTYIKVAPICPSRPGGYTLNATGTVTSDGAVLLPTGTAPSTTQHAHF